MKLYELQSNPKAEMGFEPMTSCLQDRRSKPTNLLCHKPKRMGGENPHNVRACFMDLNSRKFKGLNLIISIGDKREESPEPSVTVHPPIYLKIGILNKILVETGIEPVKQTHHHDK